MPLVGHAKYFVNAPSGNPRIAYENLLFYFGIGVAATRLGDSFLRIYQSDQPGSAGFIAHLAVEFGFDLASIVSDGGASTLVRQQLYRKPALLAGKKVVIWEFVERDIRFGTEGWQDVPLPVLEANGD